jgi:hypothetical protein
MSYVISNIFIMIKTVAEMLVFYNNLGRMPSDCGGGSRISAPGVATGFPILVRQRTTDLLQM